MSRLLPAAVVLFLCAGGLQAEIIHVYPGGSIQAAIIAAAPGDEIVVHPGTYGELINFNGKAVTLRSSDGPAVTTINGKETGTVVTCHSGEGPSTVLEGFTILNGRTNGQGGGMYIQSAHPTVRNCVFYNNHAQYGGGVFIHTAHPTLEGCVFERNAADSSGGGVYNYNLSPAQPAALFVDCTVIDNTAEVHGGGVRNWDATPTFRGCEFTGNHARYFGAGVSNGGASHATFTDCRFISNRTDTLYSNWDCQGGGMSNTDTSSPVLVNCVFDGNAAVAMLPWKSYGGAVHNTGSARPAFTNCTLARNRADVARAFYNIGASLPTLTNCIVWNGGSEIRLEGMAGLEISYTCMTGLSGGTGNISLDPLLKANLRLDAESPCINAGDPAYHPPGGRDPDGHARVLCGRVDMGAYEFGIGDYDCNRVIDVQDFILSTQCLTGPDAGPYASGCEPLDFEYDQDVDLTDLAAFQAVFGTPP